MNFEEPLDKKIRSCNGNAKSLNKLFTKLARAAEDFSDILDEFDPDAVVATIETEVFSNVPSTIPSSVLSPICAFLAKWFDENIADHMVREDWVHSAMSAVERFSFPFHII